MLAYIRTQLFTLLCFGLFLTLAGCPTQTQDREQELAIENTFLTQQNHELQVKADSLAEELATVASSDANTGSISSADVNRLQRKGLQDPIRMLKADLLKRPKLIPVRGVVGGSMHFYEDKIQVLNRKWVLAYFEDGHRAGEMLLEYNVSDKGLISWKVIDTILK